ncbi:Coenzyme F420 hydrogenase/dehydrogenase, beta subunit C-terminal domain [Desulfolucanica intricata]|uniref:Coenzyme F420 hydrogenase/dehydrogenase, beta subunit C-terminal domain n=1 Tax=Desulfolucanica intricata TaxID=1285191 RepID=UPI000834D621|nr:Coenzyme F420 hydrogenase/dehydrogenase, beta subunit C-terminal domain [Desulfolucanica intricata]
MKNEKTVEKTVRLGLCVSCGICKAACPQGAIRLDYTRGQYCPVVLEKCNLCGLCLKVCPGIEIRFADFNKNKIINISNDLILGPVINAYICFTKDKKIRNIATSGGVITSLIIELLNSKNYQGAFVLPFTEASTNLQKTIYTNDIETIMSASKSKYLPASVENVIEHLKKIKTSSIVVGTPCQIYGIKKYMKTSGIQDSNTLFLGLFCDKTLNYNALNYFECIYGKGRKIKKFEYRSKEKDGWPGHTKIVFDNKEELFVHRKVRMELKKFFQLKRCLFCLDKFNRLADISFGDCYIPGKESILGKSNIIVRTEKGLNALNYSNNIVLEEIDPNYIVSSQKLNQKNQNLTFAKIFEINNGHCIYPEYENKKYIDKKIYKTFYRHQKYIEYGRNVKKFKFISYLIKYYNIKKFVTKVFKRIGNIFGVKQ